MWAWLRQREGFWKALLSPVDTWKTWVMLPWIASSNATQSYMYDPVSRRDWPVQFQSRLCWLCLLLVAPLPPSSSCAAFILFLFFLLFSPWVIWSQNYVIFICIHPTLLMDTCWFRHHIGVCIEQHKCMCAHTYACAQHMRMCTHARAHPHKCARTHTFLLHKYLAWGSLLGGLQVSCHAPALKYVKTVCAGQKLQTQNVWSWKHLT